MNKILVETINLLEGMANNAEQLSHQPRNTQTLRETYLHRAESFKRLKNGLEEIAKEEVTPKVTTSAKSLPVFPKGSRKKLIEANNVLHRVEEAISVVKEQLEELTKVAA